MQCKCIGHGRLCFRSAHLRLRVANSLSGAEPASPPSSQVATVANGFGASLQFESPLPPLCTVRCTAAPLHPPHCRCAICRAAQGMDHGSSTHAGPRHCLASFPVGCGLPAGVYWLKVKPDRGRAACSMQTVQSLRTACMHGIMDSWIHGWIMDGSVRVVRLPCLLIATPQPAHLLAHTPPACSWLTDVTSVRDSTPHVERRERGSSSVPGTLSSLCCIVNSPNRLFAKAAAAVGDRI